MAASIGRYLIHMRPRSWLIVAGHMTVGFAVARGEGLWQLSLSDGLRLAAGCGIWTVLLNGGTLALNTAYDKDEGDIGYLRNPPPIPKHLANIALLVLLAGVMLSAFLGWLFWTSYAVCFLMSLLYSVPPIRLKARAGYDLAINSLGYGALTFFAGFAVTRLPITGAVTLATLGYLFLFAGFYPLTQLYQLDEDSRHGDHTLAVAMGRSQALWFALLCVLGAFAAFFGSVALSGVGLKNLGLVLALTAWIIVLVPWLIRGSRYPEEKGMYRALKAWGVTDVAIVVSAVLGT
jgi:lycopene elongase/hydratase (dihydrobisanhydrobacterioruberin-forming)